MAFDGGIYEVHGEPIAARIKERGNGTYRFTDRVYNFPAAPGPVDIGHMIELYVTDNTVGMRGFLPDVENSIIG